MLKTALLQPFQTELMCKSKPFLTQDASITTIKLQKENLRKYI